LPHVELIKGLEMVLEAARMKAAEDVLGDLTGAGFGEEPNEA